MRASARLNSGSVGRGSRVTRSVSGRRSLLVHAPTEPRRTAATWFRSLVLASTLAVAIYYGGPIASVYVRYWRLVNEMEVDAEIAPGINDQALRRRLVAKIDQLGLPQAAARFKIERTRNPSAIEISTVYQETLKLPFHALVVTLSPEVRAPLPRGRPTIE